HPSPESHSRNRSSQEAMRSLGGRGPARFSPSCARRRGPRNRCLLRSWRAPRQGFEPARNLSPQSSPRFPRRSPPPNFPPLLVAHQRSRSWAWAPELSRGEAARRFRHWLAASRELAAKSRPERKQRRKRWPKSPRAFEPRSAKRSLAWGALQKLTRAVYSRL